MCVCVCECVCECESYKVYSRRVHTGTTTTVRSRRIARSTTITLAPRDEIIVAG